MGISRQPATISGKERDGLKIMSQLSLFSDEKQFLWQFHGKVLASEWRDTPGPLRTHLVVHIIADCVKAPNREAAVKKFTGFHPEARHVQIVCVGEEKKRKQKTQ